MAESGTKTRGRTPADATDGPAPGARLFADLLFADAGEMAGAPYDSAQLDAIAGSAFAFLAQKPAQGCKIRIWSLPEAAGTSIIEVLNDDMPFLVDSVIAEIHAREIPVQLVLHPIFKTRRKPDGRIEQVTGPGDRNWKDHQESFIQVHVGALGEAAAADLQQELVRILTEVREAVSDWTAMLDRIRAVIAAYASAPPPIPPEELKESIAFLKWLIDGNYTFLGMRELELKGGPESGELVARPGYSLGVLRDPAIRVLRRSEEASSMTPEVRKFFFEPVALIVSKANTLARVHRRVHMDYVGAKIYGPGGAIAGELRIAGLFTSAAYTSSVSSIPLLRHKVEKVVAGLGHPPDSHSGKAVVNVLETFPRDELFQVRPELLQQWVEGILDLELRPRARVFLRPDEFDRFVSALVYVPRERFSSEVRQRIADVLVATYRGRLAAFTPFFVDSRLVRIQYIIAAGEEPIPDVEGAEIERQVAQIVLSWQDRLAGALEQGPAAPAASALLAKYGSAFSGGYRETFEPVRALEDIARLEQLSDRNPVGIDFYREEGAPPSQVRVVIYRLGDPIPLSDRVPVLENLGFRVIDERSYRVAPLFDGSPRNVRLHDMALETDDGQPLKPGADDVRLEECYLAIWRGEAENDGYNRLIKAAGIGWRGAAVARAYGAYLKQIGTPFGQRYLAETLVRYQGVAADLAELFTLRFDPDRALAPADRASKEAEVRARIEEALSGVQVLDEDRILRHFLNLMLATKRTNFYQRTPEGAEKETISFKLASREVDGLPAPKPFAEIWVYSPRIEAVHLRFAPIARGGIRWSDRAQDFRTEVLGLVKAQQVKNTVIVPQGAKGGFYPKRLLAKGSREEIQKEGIASYRLFINSLLDLTDNLVNGALVPPERVVRYDTDDPYLVVAADKGTATFSDIANELSAGHGFWLGDAFASGGSAGYDHKKMAITARGGWECVKRHFREMDIDIQSQPFTVVGVGDMSGDVFGNAMLLSRQIRLIAAFDHRDIFLDPDPDPARSFAERERMFSLPRSSWQDYDRSVISTGGGVFARSAKSVSLSPQVQRMLGISAESLTPADLVRAILRAQADLLWFGGIGTFVRASSESDEQVGDRSNDAQRVAARELRVKVIGEGANLAMTQRARIEFALAGGRLNTDFIDNSAGVNSSDQEVNIKIAFGPLMSSGALGILDRNAVLVSMTDEVGAACLRNNYLQSLAISLGQTRGLADLGFQQRLIRELEHQGRLDRQLEALPTDMEIASRIQSGVPLTRPELAVLLSYAKIELSQRLLQGSLPDDPYLEATLHAYFPHSMRERFPQAIVQHRLRRAIIVTVLTNQVINRGGSTMLVRLEEETGHDAESIVRAFTAVVAVYGLEGLWHRIDALDGQVKGAAQLELYRETQDLVRRQTAWFLRHGRLERGLAQVIAEYSAGVDSYRLVLPAVIGPGKGNAMEARKAGFTAAGVPEDLASAIASLDGLAEASDLTAVAIATGRSVAEIAPIHTRIGEHFRLGELRAAANALALTEYFDRLALNSTMSLLSDTQREITRTIAGAGGDAAKGFEAWLGRRGASAGRAKASLDEIVDGGTLTLARLTVAAAQVRDLAAP